MDEGSLHIVRWLVGRYRAAVRRNHLVTIHRPLASKTKGLEAFDTVLNKRDYAAAERF